MNDRNMIPCEPKIENVNTPLTMSSREIAEVCNTRHNQVIETIERLFKKGVLRESRKTLRDYFSPNGGRPTKVYDLSKLDTLKVVSGYNETLRGKIIDRWQELENASKRQSLAVDYSDPKLILGVVTHLREESAKKDMVIANLRPKVAAYKHLTRIGGSTCITDAAKALGITPRYLFSYLEKGKWIYRRKVNGRYAPYQDKIQLGYMDCRVISVRNADGFKKIAIEPRLTAKGKARLAEFFSRTSSARRAIQ
ncbi:anti-repressor protein [Bartonella australis AUST/NH1]|uniref:Anti-repressor protein n=1 Tax=Bartonella australis (strain Aust/NH1) TaxID=1094489 RepID=M1N2K3_BARAA|nr:phage antirepressor KilAC domain-containing protein [Bartonella australis]AGF74144.1 anti-repressor protein [Bartonella australis AUST/NH1]